MHCAQRQTYQDVHRQIHIPTKQNTVLTHLPQQQNNWFTINHLRYQGSTEITALVHLDVDVDVADESECRKEGDGSKHEEEDVAGEERVAEKLGHLQRARHIGAPEVVEHRVEEDEESGRSGIKSNP